MCYDMVYDMLRHIQIQPVLRHGYIKTCIALPTSVAAVLCLRSLIMPLTSTPVDLVKYWLITLR